MPDTHPPRVVATATATPEHIIDAEVTKRYLRRVFGTSHSDLARADRIVDHTGTERRAISLPIEQLIEQRGLQRDSEIYAETARRLGRQVSLEALTDAGLAATDVDMVIAVSCTGYMIPSLAAHLARELGMRSDVRSLPITELGCGGGVAGLALAANFVRAQPDLIVLLVSVELCSLCFQLGDQSWQNVVAATLFGDGAAAAIVTDRALGGGAEILADRSQVFPGTADYMQFNLKDSGFELVMSPHIPEVVLRDIPALIADFLGHHELSRRDLGFFVLHPGGSRILRNYRRAVDIPEEWLAPAAEVLRRYGNMSSATVLFVLHEIMRGQQPEPGALGLAGGFGPGFGAELLLLRWQVQAGAAAADALGAAAGG